MRVIIDNNTAMELLMNRLSEFWHIEPTGDTETTYKLFEQMYEQYVFEGCFDDTEFEVDVIVDNDYVNWCRVVSEGDDNYEEIKQAYENDEYEIDNLRIEAEYNGSFLVRYC